MLRHISRTIGTIGLNLHYERILLHKFGQVTACRFQGTQPEEDRTPSIPSHLDLAGDWTSADQEIILQDMTLHLNFISEADEAAIMDEIGSNLRRQRYEFDHWDDAIHGFRETQRLEWNERNAGVLERVKQMALGSNAVALRHLHILDLAPEGVIKPHVDSVRYCGSTISGLSLLSDAVMRLVPTTASKSGRHVDIHLPRRSLYVMKNTARYDYTHEILAADVSVFRSRVVNRSRRVSVLCRSPPPTQQPQESPPTQQP